MIGVVSRYFSVFAVVIFLASCGSNFLLSKDEYNKYTGELKCYHHLGRVKTSENGTLVTIKEVVSTKTNQRSYFLQLMTGYEYKKEPNVIFNSSKNLYLLVDGKPFSLDVRPYSLFTISVLDPSVEIIHGYEIVPGVMSNSKLEFKNGTAVAYAEYSIPSAVLNKLKSAQKVSMMYYLTNSSSGIMGSFAKKHIDKLQSFKPVNISEKIEALSKSKKKK